MSTISGVRQEPCTSTERPVKQLSSTDSKIKNIAKTAFQKISEFFAYCKSAYATLKAKCLALRARITSFFKKSDSSSQPSQRSESFSGERAQRNSVESRSRSPSLDNAQPAQVSEPELTPTPGALIPCQSNPFSQAPDAAMQEIYNRSLRSFVANNFELPSPAETVLYTLHPFTLLSVNASQPVPPERSGPPSPVNNQPAQQSEPELTPQTLALIPYQPNPVLQRLNAAMQEVSNKSLRSLVANDVKVPLPPMEAPLGTLHPTMLLAENASQPEIPVATGASVDAGQVLAREIEFALRQNRRNTPPFANVEQFSQLSLQQKSEISQQPTANVPFTPAEGQTTQPSGSNVPAYIFGASAAVIAGAAVFKEHPELVNQIASGATTAAQSVVKIAQPVLARAFEAATNGVQTVADALKSVAANAQFINGEVVIDLG